jgi:hypothetical protein
MFVKYLLYTAAEWRQGQGPGNFLKKTLRTLFKKSLKVLGIFNYLKRHYEGQQKIPESLGGIQNNIS